MRGTIPLANMILTIFPPWSPTRVLIALKCVQIKSTALRGVGQAAGCQPVNPSEMQKSAAVPANHDAYGKLHQVKSPTRAVAGLPRGLGYPELGSSVASSIPPDPAQSVAKVVASDGLLARLPIYRFHASCRQKGSSAEQAYTSLDNYK